MSNTSKIASVIIMVFLLMKSASPAVQCLKDDFGDGTLGLFDEVCASGAFSAFVAHKYSDFADTVPKPAGSNDYFISPNPTNANCIENDVDIEVVSGTDIHLYVFTSNPGTVIILIWTVIDTTSGALVASSVVSIDDSQTWLHSSLTIPRDATIKIRLQCEELLTKNAFLAIDYIRIKAPAAEECLFNVTTTSFPPTVTNPSTDLPPDTPCNCVCNCNFYCSNPLY